MDLMFMWWIFKGDVMNMLYGTQIIIDNRITKKVRCRKHKKRRIDKKWLKRYGYKEVPDNEKVIWFEDRLIMTQKCYDGLKVQMLKEES